MTMSIAMVQQSRTPPVSTALDVVAQQAFQATGVVCLLAGLVRCLACSAPMRIRPCEVDGAVHVCGLKGSAVHPIPVATLNDSVWRLHTASSPRLGAVTDLAARRAVIWRNYAVVVVTPDLQAAQPIVSLYHRPSL